MSFNIKRHIYTSVISWWDVSLCVFKHQSAFLSLSASLCLRRFDGFSVKMPEFHSWTVRAQIAKSHRISRNPTSYGCFVCYKKKFLMKYMLNRISLHCRVEHIDLQKSFESICQGPTHVLISFFLSSSTCPQNTCVGTVQDPAISRVELFIPMCRVCHNRAEFEVAFKKAHVSSQ